MKGRRNSYFKLLKIAMGDFHKLISTFQPTIFTWSYYSDFDKTIEHSFSIKVELNILNSLLWEENIEQKFIQIIKEYPETRETLPILLAVRERFKLILDSKTKDVKKIDYLFNKKTTITADDEIELLKFFNESWLRKIFQDKSISNLNDYVFWIETWLDSNARKNRSGKLMEDIIESFISDFCKDKDFQYKDQATAKRMLENWWVNVESDKSSRRFDFAIYTWTQIYLIETNFYGWGWSKLKSVAWEFSNLYRFLWEQDIPLIRITDGKWRDTALNPLEEAFHSTEWNIYNIESLKNWALEKIII